MTELEKAVANALRLSEASAERLLPEIQRNINTAREELIRSGCLVSEAEEKSGALVEDAIITFCLVKMGDEDEKDRNEVAFLYQQDNLRKTYREKRDS